MLKIKLLILLLTLLFLTGCWDQVELEEQAYVVAIGLDNAKGNSISVTFQIANPQGGGGSTIGRSENEPPQEVITVVAPDIISARDLITTSVTRRPTFSHTSTLIVSEALARSDDFFKILEATIRERQIRRDTFLIISREKAEDFIRNNNPKLETRPHKYYQFMESRWQESAVVPISDLHRFFQRTESDAGLFIGIYASTEKINQKLNGNEDEFLPGQVPKEGGNSTELIGGAIFKEGKMIGVINGEENRFAHYFRPNFKISSVIATYPDPLAEDYRIIMRLVKREKTKVDMDLSKDKPIINVTVPILMDIVNIPSTIDYVEDSQNQELLKKSIEGYLNKGAKELVKKSQNEFGGEFFRWHLVARKKFWTLEEYSKYDWMKSYPKADVTVKFDIKFKAFGKQLSPPDYKKLKD